MTPTAHQYLYFDEIEDVLSSVDLLATIVPLVDATAKLLEMDCCPCAIPAHTRRNGLRLLAATSSIPRTRKDIRRENGGNTLRTGEGQPEQWLAKFDQLLERRRDGKCMSRTSPCN